ncbi:MAG: zinc ABC transporter substrate-binding protein [Clostridia bacterium]|nr:zinc ABC transporter substrate-binding protein [Clostridia bacterium]
MKKSLSVLLVVLLLAGCCFACSSGEKPASDGRIRIVTTIFPEYDWVRNVLGDNPANIEVTMLLDTGVDLHSFQPTAADILTVSACDLFIYVGGESDDWVKDALQESGRENRIVINLLDVLGDAVKEEEVVEGMQEEAHDEADGEEEEVEYDEHVWLSLQNAVVLTESISEAIQKIDPDHAETYRRNATAYTEKLNALDTEFRSVTENAPQKTLLFGDRFPFRYLTDDYGLSYYAAFVGCSAETEASFETIIFLANKVDELSLHAVMTIEGTDHRIAETIVQNTQSKDQTILALDSMQATTAKDVQNGVTYLSVMEKNLAVLMDALK